MPDIFFNVRGLSGQLPDPPANITLELSPNEHVERNPHLTIWSNGKPNLSSTFQLGGADRVGTALARMRLHTILVLYAAVISPRQTLQQN
jgi:hypothetical protein